MQTSVTFKNLEPSEHLKTFVKDKLNRLDKLLENQAEANVVLSIEKMRHMAEIHLSSGRISINAKEENIDMYAAIDLVLDKLKKQIKKNKQKRRTGPKRVKNKGFEESESPFPEDDTGGRRVRVRNIEYKPMDVEEAVMQMDLVPDHFFVFTNSRTERVNVLYRRKDGDFGLIQPSSF